MERLSAAEAPADRIRDVVVGDSESSSDMRRSLMEALEEAPTDRWAIAERLAAVTKDNGGSLDELLSKEASAPVIHDLQILRIEGDLDMTVDPPRTRTREPRVKAVIRCTPPARSVVGLDHLRLSVLHRPDRSNELIDVGINKTKKVSSLGRGNDVAWSTRLDVDELDAGLYVIRVEAIDQENFVRRFAESDPFAVREAQPVESDVARDVTGFASAALEARRAAGRPPGASEVVYSRPGEGSETEDAHDHYIVRFAEAPGSYSTRGTAIARPHRGLDDRKPTRPCELHALRRWPGRNRPGSHWRPPEDLPRCARGGTARDRGASTRPGRGRADMCGDLRPAAHRGRRDAISRRVAQRPGDGGCTHSRRSPATGSRHRPGPRRLCPRGAYASLASLRG